MQTAHADQPAHLTPSAREAILRQIYPSDAARDVPQDEVYGGLELPAGPSVSGARPYIILNMVSTVDGKVALAGSAAGIGSRADRLVMRQVRSLVDAVIIAAGTLRAEICDPRVDLPFVRRRLERGLAGQPLAVGVSASLDLEPTNRFLVNGRERTVLITTREAPATREARLTPYATILRHGQGRVDLAAALRTLAADFGVRLLLCEGGPSLNQQLLDAGLIDELFWTLAPKLAGGAGKTMLQGPSPTARIAARLELVSLFEEAGELFARYRLPRGASGAYLRQGDRTFVDVPGTP
ncbi:MAG: dihydrofolate reductase family protein [Chloroflexi bacterium]|nr:dihydrofolate reductase family protein [Chloroflexota bacterium]